MSPIKRTRYRNLKRTRYRNRGFTLIESLIVIAVVGIMAVTAAPSFGNMLDSMRVNQATVEIRAYLSNAQRQALRNMGVCEAGLLTNQYSIKTNQTNVPSNIHVDCLPNKEENFSEKVIVASNMLPLEQSDTSTVTGPITLPKDVAKWCEKHKKHNHAFWSTICSQPETTETEEPILSQIRFAQTGVAEFDVKSSSGNPLDPSGKIVLYTRGREKSIPKCVVLSKRLGLTRIGSYSGELSQSDITNGTCTAQEWNKQV